MVEINSAAVKGESGTGFEKGGPFKCGVCEYFTGEACTQKDMLKYSKQPRVRDGVEVAAEDCCAYFDRGSRSLLNE